MAGSNCQPQNSRPIFLGSSRPCHSPSVPLSLGQGRPHSCRVKLDTSWSLEYRTPLAQILSPQETIWKPVAHGLMVSFDRQAGPTFGCALNQTIGSRVQWKAGLDNTVSTTPDVVTGSHQLSKFEIVVATFTVYHWWSNKPCSRISKIVGSQVPDWCCIQVSVPFVPK